LKVGCRADLVGQLGPTLIATARQITAQAA
jgi:hypothetical protein